jgi:hypothetical protein
MGAHEMSKPSDQDTGDDQASEAGYGPNPNMIGAAKAVQDRRANPFKQSEDIRQPAPDADWADGFNDTK